MRREKHSNYSKVRANRIAFSKPNAEGLPHNFSLLTERTGGMALPISGEQMNILATKYNVGIVISCIEDENCPPVEFFTNNNIKHISFDWRDRSSISVPLVRFFIYFYLIFILI